MKSAIFQTPLFPFQITPSKEPRKQTKNGPIPHESRPEMKKGNVAHVTIKLRKGLPCLRDTEALKVVLAAIERVNGGKVIRIVEFSILSNHVHMLIEAQTTADLSKGMASLNTGLGMRLNRLWDRTGQGSVFQERFHLVIITSPTQMRYALLYVLLNAQRHGLPIFTLDPCSSAPSFGGWKEHQNSKEVAAAREKCVSVPPKTWLFEFGWQQAGPTLSSHLPHSIDMTQSGATLQA